MKFGRKKKIAAKTLEAIGNRSGVAGIDHVESAIIGLFGVSELMVGEKFVDVGFGKTSQRRLQRYRPMPVEL